MEFNLDTIPFSLEDIKYAPNWLKFRHFEELYLAAKEEDSHGDSIYNLACAIHHVTGIPLNSLLDDFPLAIHDKTVDIEDGPIEVDSKIWNGDYVIDIGDELSLTRLYAHITTVRGTHMSAIDPKNISKWTLTCPRGDTYRIDQDLFEGMIDDRNLSAGISILTLNAQSTLSEKVGSRRSYNVQYDMSMHLQTLAYLLRKVDEDGEMEKIPMMANLREEFIDQKQSYFRTWITCKDVFDVYFFLSSTLENVAKRIISVDFGKADPQLAKWTKTLSVEAAARVQ